MSRGARPCRAPPCTVGIRPTQASAGLAGACAQQLMFVFGGRVGRAPGFKGISVQRSPVLVVAGFETDDDDLPAIEAERDVAEGIVFRGAERLEPMTEGFSASHRLAFQVFENFRIDIYGSKGHVSPPERETGAGPLPPPFRRRILRECRQAPIACGPGVAARWSGRDFYVSTRMTTRRFFARPSRVLFGATGSSAP